MQNINISLDSLKVWVNEVSEYIHDAPIDEQAAWGCIAAGIMIILVSLFL